MTIKRLDFEGTETMSGFAYTNLFAKSVPAPAVRFAGYPKYNFIGGHNDPTLIPVEGLIEATASALRKEGSKLAMYTAAQGSQGHPLRGYDG